MSRTPAEAGVPAIGWPESEEGKPENKDLASSPKGEQWKVEFAKRLREETTAKKSMDRSPPEDGPSEIRQQSGESV